MISKTPPTFLNNQPNQFSTKKVEPKAMLCKTLANHVLACPSPPGHNQQGIKLDFLEGGGGANMGG